jgi:hypothetical protein
VKRNALFIAPVALVAIVGSVAGCGGSGASMAPSATATTQSPAPQAHTQSLDTGQLLEQARQVSETADPYAVNDGVLKLTDTSDETDPILVNAV